MPITHPQRPAPLDAPIATEGRDISDPQLIALLASAVSAGFLLHYYKWGQILLSGDAVAHINIARRVFDSRRPGPLQLGTVWLPLQHVLTIPFIVSDWLWSSGIGGAVPSMAAYVLGALGMYRLVRGGLESIGGTRDLARLAAWLAAAIYAANPNLIYLQTTALNEPLSLALLVWATVYFTEFVHLARVARVSDPGSRVEDPRHTAPEQASRRLRWCGWLLMCGMLVRYDVWFDGCVFVMAALFVLIATGRSPAEGGRATPHALRRAFVHFVLINAIAPVLWFAYNAALWGNPLEFATGQYSAKAIQERSRQPGDPRYPGWHSTYVAAEYFLRDVKLNLGGSDTHQGAPASPWERPWLPIAVAGTVLVMAAARPLLPWLLLWVPLPFYALSIAWGSVPVFFPQWWPFGYVNTRYGLQLLPAMAAFFGVVAYFLMRLRRARWWPVLVIVAMAAVVAGSYASVWRNVPICLREIRANGAGRYGLDTALGATLRKLPESSTFLMYLGEHSGALQRSGIPIRRTINESDAKVWDRALQSPAASADFIVAAEGDPVAQAVAAHPGRLQTLIVLHVPGQAPVTIYRALK